MTRPAIDDLDLLLDLVDCQITYRARYLVGVALAPVRDLAMLDPFNPRSVAFQIERCTSISRACRCLSETACWRSRSGSRSRCRPS